MKYGMRGCVGVGGWVGANECVKGGRMGGGEWVLFFVYWCVCVCARARGVCGCVCAYVSACVRACVLVCVCA